ncbi:alcohol dehydrogenase-like isoform X1 [Ptychodera flava]|uniref:alcohol dehydrogenase-like isoform X1 n=2 Tax=Ptychodera flava TaxID=63121 RepID=UPI00396A0D81
MAQQGTMRCVKLVELAPSPLQYIEDHPMPSLPKEGAIVKVSYCGVCHSDVHLWHESPVLPVILGHEMTGTVHAIGDSAENAEGLSIGDDVLVYPWIGCEECKFCCAGRTDLCQRDWDPDTTIEMGCSRDGGYAEYVAVPKVKYLVPLPESIPKESAGMLACGMLTAFNVVRTAIKYIDEIMPITGNCGILVIGGGGLGLSAIKLFKYLVKTKYEKECQLLCADIAEDKLSLALEFGCDDVVHWPIGDSPEELTKKTMSSFPEGGPRIVLDFVGRKQTFTVAYKSILKHGKLINIGLHGDTAEIPLFDATMKSFGMQCVYAGTIQQMKELVNIFAEGKVTPLPYTVHDLEDAVDLISKLEAGKIEGRAILKLE